jgi:hypothetical protein
MEDEAENLEPLVGKMRKTVHQIFPRPKPDGISQLPLQLLPELWPKECGRSDGLYFQVHLIKASPNTLFSGLPSCCTNPAYSPEVRDDSRVTMWKDPGALSHHPGQPCDL